MNAFHAYDIRGIYNKDFDSTDVYKVGYFIPELLCTDKVLVGRDCRTSSPEIHDSLVRGITDAGADVYDIGLSSTPLAYYGTASYGFKASVQITASHNSAEYNGLKVSRENAGPVGLDSGLQQIKDWIQNGRPTPTAPVKGKIHEMNIREDYLSFLRKYMDDSSELKLAFDLSNGMACLFAKEIFGERHSYLFDTMDGSFPNHDPNPLLTHNHKWLRESVLGDNADLGVIFDGDADRVMFLDDKGRFISPDLMIALLGLYFVEERGEKGTVLQDIRSSKSVAEFLEPLGAKVETWRVGRAFAAPKLRELNGVWGGELAGHYYFRDFFYSDSGMLASILAIRVASRLKRQGISMSKMVDRISHYRNSGEINFRVEDKTGAMEAVREFFCAQEDALSFMDFDGYRIEFRDWWFNIRPSNTEPYLRFLCEATNEEMLRNKIEQTWDLLRTNFGAEKA